MKITMELLIEIFREIGSIMTQESEHLCRMDALLGDGDLGLTMKKGFSELPGILEAMPEDDIGKRLMMGGMKLSSIVPSTMGTLMSSGLMGAGKAVMGKSELDADGFVAFLAGFEGGIIRRGKCSRGDCTILDAIGPAREAAEETREKTGNLPQIVSAALAGAEAGVEATKEMLPRFGKALVQREKARGVADQGAYCGALFLRGFYRVLYKS